MNPRECRELIKSAPGRVTEFAAATNVHGSIIGGTLSHQTPPSFAVADKGWGTRDKWIFLIGVCAAAVVAAVIVSH